MTAEQRTSLSRRNDGGCATPYTTHSYQQHPDDRRLWVCAGCGDDLECTCAMTEASQANCEVHGYEGIEL